MEYNINERASFLLSIDYFKDKLSLVEEILTIEQLQGMKFPTQIQIKELPIVDFGEQQIHIGKIEGFYFFRMLFQDGTEKSEFFDSQQKIKLFFSKMDIDGKITIMDENNVEREEEIVPFWINRISLLEDDVF